jgi:hypothetical protein
MHKLLNAADDLGAQGLARARAYIHVPPTSGRWHLSHGLGKSSNSAADVLAFL